MEGRTTPDVLLDAEGGGAVGASVVLMEEGAGGDGGVVGITVSVLLDVKADSVEGVG